MSFVKLATAQTNDAYRMYIVYLNADLKYEVLIDLRSNVFYSQYKSTWSSLPNKDLLTQEGRFIENFVSTQITFTTVPRFMQSINFVREYPVVDVLTKQ